MDYYSDFADGLGGICDRDTAFDRIFLRTLVQRHITCPHTDKFLDVTTAVAVEIEGIEGAGIMHADAYSAVADDLRHKYGDKLKVYDGRELFGNRA